jgi:cell division septal protein FtsQ
VIAMAVPEQISFLETWEEDQPAPFRRREKPIGVRRPRRSGWRGILRRALLDLVLVLALAAGCWEVASHAARSSRFELRPAKDVRLTGNHYVAGDLLLDQLGFGDLSGWGYVDILGVNLRAERMRAENIPWVQSASVSRIFPHRLALQVQERTPVAFASADGRIELVDGEGTFLPMPPRAAFDFPVVYGLNAVANAAQRQELLDAYLRFMAAAGEVLSGSGWKASEVHLGDGGDVQALLVENGQTILADFGSGDFRQRLTRFTALAPRALKSYLKIDSMDLRYSNEVVVDPAKSEPISANQVQGHAVSKVHP